MNYYKQLETSRLILRKIQKSDAAALHKFVSDEQNTMYMIWDTHTDMNETEKYVDFVLQMYEEKRILDYVFVLKSTGEVVGSGGVCNTKDFPHLAEIGYILRKDYWGQGLVFEAMSAIKEYLFNELDIHRIEGKHFCENTNSGKIMQKLGMQFEGISRDKFFIRGQYISVCTYYDINPAHKSKN